MSNNQKEYFIVSCRLSFEHLFEKVAVQEGGRECYSASLLIDKQDIATIATLEAAIGRVIENCTYPAGVKAVMKSCLGDGDLPFMGKPAKALTYPEYSGFRFLNAKSNNKPVVFDALGNEVGELNREEIYSGCYGKAKIGFYTYNKMGNIGVGANIIGFKKTDDGDRLGGASASAEEFD